MIIESAGMIAHVVNIIVLILIPMVLIHYKGHQFSLCKYNFVFYNIETNFPFIIFTLLNNQMNLNY